jgi:hypothetical protein
MWVVVVCWVWEMNTKLFREKDPDVWFRQGGQFGRVIIWFFRNIQEAWSLHFDHVFVNVVLRSFVSWGLGWLLEHFAAPTTWPSWCRWTCEGLDVSRNLIFDEHFVVRKPVLSGNFCSLHLDEQSAVGKCVIVGIFMNVRGKRWLLWILFCWFVWVEEVYFLIRGCTQEESEGKYKGEDQRFCHGEVDQKIQGRLGSQKRLVCCLVLNPLFFGYNTPL